MCQGVNSPPSITISTQELEVVHEFVYIGSTISDTLSLYVELDKSIGKAAIIFSRLTKRVWLNKKLTTHTKIQVYRVCVLEPLCMAGEEAEHLPYALSPTHFWYHLAGQSSK